MESGGNFSEVGSWKQREQSRKWAVAEALKLLKFHLSLSTSAPSFSQREKCAHRHGHRKLCGVSKACWSCLYPYSLWSLYSKCQGLNILYVTRSKSVSSWGLLSVAHNGQIYCSLVSSVDLSWIKEPIPSQHCKMCSPLMPKWPELPDKLGPTGMPNLKLEDSRQAITEPTFW